MLVDLSAVQLSSRKILRYSRYVPGYDAVMMQQRYYYSSGQSVLTFDAAAPTTRGLACEWTLSALFRLRFFQVSLCPEI